MIRKEKNKRCKNCRSTNVLRDTTKKELICKDCGITEQLGRTYELFEFYEETRKIVGYIKCVNILTRKKRQFYCDHLIPVHVGSFQCTKCGVWYKYDEKKKTVERGRLI